MNFRRIVKKFIPVNLFKKIEPYGHLLEAVLLNALHGFPLRGLKVIGVTGTNGKTTTSFLVHKMLTEAGFKPGLMSTVAYGVGDDIQPQIAHMTSVSVPMLLKRVKIMKAQGMDWLVLETTSHALAQHRVWGMPYSVAVMTNVTHEHLDYHGTFERYVEAKKMLFKQTNQNKKGLRVGVVNAEDPNARSFTAITTNSITYGRDRGDLQARQIRLTPVGSQYVAVIEDDEYLINCHLPGSFNVSNSLAAVAVGRAIGLTRQQIEDGIAALTAVEGRMTRIDEGQDFDVIVDFAHTPDSFEKLFKDIKPVVKGRLIVMFGSAGRRDEAKRAVQGKLAGEFADEVIITEEDDRDIDGVEIMNQIASGAEEAGKKPDQDLFLVHDRTEAINFSIQRAKKGDTVLLLGKGHEKTIERADGEYPWDEISTAHTVLNTLLATR
ncbi:UDP-N-acetylmuramoyl-L-alanyl-D-glutamate--2,6-diaminopimelate ligase [Candidatus Saccharibacteria bacterium]|nr:UDP-N-acetylmuramoyl-L-alanyl-D-glutamate--2,6-diaminopimelate ligase [Candidatus Saccharibacteria bacterium]MBI3337959.1 UDP-N-acetylmuramoyl-L-alanyl-D-glutamate--2,6-diaminopimelate ligase [Candidatus Saccharibacteria bacterium]